MIHVRSARGKNAQGRKVTGIEPMPGEDKLLVTSNDSRIRLYDLRDLTLSCKYKGYANSSSQIRASFSHDGKYITAGSENQCVFLWRTHYEPNNLSVSRKDRNDHYEAIKAHNAVVTQSVFAPVPQLVFDQLEQNSGDPLNQQQQPADDSRSESKFNASSSGNTSFKKDKSKDANKTNPGPGYVIISGDYDGEIKVFLNAVKPKHSSLP